MFKKITSVVFAVSVCAAVGCSKGSTSEQAPQADPVTQAQSAAQSSEQGSAQSTTAAVGNVSRNQTSSTATTTTTGIATNGAPTQTQVPVLSGSPVGTYNGYILRADKTVVPVSLMLQVKLNSTSGTSQLQANLRLGLFGGVTVGSTQVTYDFTDGLLTVDFPTNQGSYVEITGYIQGDQLVNGVISGTTSGQQNLALSKKNPNYYSNASTAIFNVAFSSNTGGELTLVPQIEAVASGQTSDLPLIPSLDASFRASGLSFSPVSADKTYYDPLTARMDLVYTANGGRIHFENVALKSEDNPTPAKFTGYAIQGAAPIANLVATYKSSTIRAQGYTGNVQYFAGKFLAPAGQSYPTEARLEYNGSDGTNPTSVILPKFPMMTLKVFICRQDGGEFGGFDFQTISIDAISGLALFQTTDKKTNFQAQFTSGLVQLKGNVTTPRGQSSPTGELSKLQFKNIPKSKWGMCGK